jgi:hypothetical protein
MLDDTDTKTDLIAALQDTAMLCGLRTRALGLSRTHKTASTQVTAQHGATTNAATVRVNRLADADAYHRKLVGLQNNMRKIYEAHTLPWDGAGGWRLLPNTSFLKLAGIMAPLQREIALCIEEYRAKAPEIIEAAKRNLGDLALEIALPTVEELSNAYEVKLEFGSIPDTKALKNLPPAITGKLAQHMQNRAQTAYETALGEIQERMVKPLQHLVERLDAFDERESREKTEGQRDLQGVFRDTTVTNITDLAQLLPSLNVLNDEGTTRHVNEVVELASDLNPESLRGSRERRDAARAKAASILAGMGY